MTPTIRHGSALGKAGRSAGRAFAGLMRGLFGRKNLLKMRDSAQTLKAEYDAGKREAEAQDAKPRPKRVEHRVLDPGDPPPGKGGPEARKNG